MKKKLLVLLSTCILAACSQEAAPSNAVVEQASPATTTQTQVLSSKDKKINLTVPYGQFSENAQDENINVFHDSENGITIHIAQLGDTKKDSNQYFTELSNAIKGDAALTDIQIGEITSTRLDYQFSQKNESGTLNESCATFVLEQKIYSVCADSSEADQESLATFIQSVKIGS